MMTEREPVNGAELKAAHNRFEAMAKHSKCYCSKAMTLYSVLSFRSGSDYTTCQPYTHSRFFCDFCIKHVLCSLSKMIINPLFYLSGFSGCAHCPLVPFVFLQWRHVALRLITDWLMLGISTERLLRGLGDAQYFNRASNRQQ